MKNTTNTPALKNEEEQGYCSQKIAQLLELCKNKEKTEAEQEILDFLRNLPFSKEALSEQEIKEIRSFIKPKTEKGKDSEEKEVKPSSCEAEIVLFLAMRSYLYNYKNIATGFTSLLEETVKTFVEQNIESKNKKTLSEKILELYLAQALIDSTAKAFLSFQKKGTKIIPLHTYRNKLNDVLEKFLQQTKTLSPEEKKIIVQSIKKSLERINIVIIAEKDIPENWTFLKEEKQKKYTEKQEELIGDDFSLAFEAENRVLMTQNIKKFEDMHYYISYISKKNFFHFIPQAIEKAFPLVLSYENFLELSVIIENNTHHIREQRDKEFLDTIKEKMKNIYESLQKDKIFPVHFFQYLKDTYLKEQNGRNGEETRKFLQAEFLKNHENLALPDFLFALEFAPLTKESISSFQEKINHASLLDIKTILNNKKNIPKSDLENTKEILLQKATEISHLQESDILFFLKECPENSSFVDAFLSIYAKTLPDPEETKNSPEQIFPELGADLENTQDILKSLQNSYIENINIKKHSLQQLEKQFQKVKEDREMISSINNEIHEKLLQKIYTTKEEIQQTEHDITLLEKYTEQWGKRTKTTEKEQKNMQKEITSLEKKFLEQQAILQKNIEKIQNTLREKTRELFLNTKQKVLEFAKMIKSNIPSRQDILEKLQNIFEKYANSLIDTLRYFFLKHDIPLLQ
jgi:hypothetical protein